MKFNLACFRPSKLAAINGQHVKALSHSLRAKQREDGGKLVRPVLLLHERSGWEPLDERKLVLAQMIHTANGAVPPADRERLVSEALHGRWAVPFFLAAVRPQSKRTASRLALIVPAGALPAHWGFRDPDDVEWEKETIPADALVLEVARISSWVRRTLLRSFGQPDSDVEVSLMPDEVRAAREWLVGVFHHKRLQPDPVVEMMDHLLGDTLDPSQAAFDPGVDPLEGLDEATNDTGEATLSED